MKIGITGYEGRLGAELVEGWGCDPLHCDITSISSIKKSLKEVKPDVIINCAAKTAVDSCEETSYFNQALKVNSTGVLNLLSCFSGRLIHISTDFVFTGENGPYSENDALIYPPVNAYGWTKLGGEISFGTKSDNPENVLVRITGLYGNLYGRDIFTSYLLRNLRAGIVTEVVDHNYSNYSFVPHVAEGIMNIVGRTGLPKIIHVSSDEVVNTYDFALRLIRLFGFSRDLITPVITPVKWKAKRPVQGGLKVDLAKSLKIPIYTIEDGLLAFKERVS